MFTNLKIRLYNWFFAPALYVIADTSDSSITLSRQLCRHIDIAALETAKVFVFKIRNSRAYGFCVNPAFGRGTQLCDIQYNSKYKCVGFETLCPTVARMFYDFGLCAETARVKLSVRIRRNVEDGTIYYKILPPKRK